MESPHRSTSFPVQTADTGDRSEAGRATAKPNRRASQRHLAVCRTARVMRAGDAGLWRVRNISDTGMMLAADVPLRIGERLEIALSESTTLQGSIKWAEGGRCGVAFDETIDAAALLRQLADEQRSAGYRALRLPVEIEAILLLRSDAVAIDLVDISQHGAGYRCSERLEPGSEVEILLPGETHRRRALVRWSRRQRGGLWFAEPLDRTSLESVARLRR